MNCTPTSSSLPRSRPWTLRSALMLLASVLWFALALAIFPPAASAQQGTAGFDHSSTMFPLFGAHEQVRCETCHIKGIFKGTPRACGDCHVQNNQRGALAKPFDHIPTTQSCDACHNMASFSGVLFSHVTVMAGTCATCHNGVRASGKSPTHIATTQSCDACHVTSAFLPVRSFDHSTLNGNFSTCADHVRADRIGKTMLRKFW